MCVCVRVRACVRICAFRGGRDREVLVSQRVTVGSEVISGISEECVLDCVMCVG